MSGKGSAPRPLSVSDEEFGKRFDAIDWSDARVPERKLMLGKQVMFCPGGQPPNFNPDDFNVLAVDSE